MSGIRSLRRGATIVGSATGASAPIYVDSDDNLVKFIPAGTGSTEVQQIDTSATAQTKSGALRLSGATAGIGYATGAGGTVTQATSKSTGVTLNTITGQITMNAASLAADTTVSFTLTDSAIAATDLLLLNHISAGTAGSYLLNAQAGAGTASIGVRNITAGALAEAIVIAFAVVKAVTA